LNIKESNCDICTILNPLRRVDPEIVDQTIILKHLIPKLKSNLWQVSVRNSQFAISYKIFLLIIVMNKINKY
jgi:hypothetical protein